MPNDLENINHSQVTGSSIPVLLETISGENEKNSLTTADFRVQTQTNVWYFLQFFHYKVTSKI